MTIRSLFALGVLALAGCGPGSISAPKAYPVSGTVTYGGRPAAGVRVELHPQLDIGKVKFSPSGLTDKSGRFTVSTLSPGDGAPAGDYLAAVTWPQTSSDANGLEIEIDGFGGRFADAKSGRFKVRVEKRDNLLPPIALE